MAPKISVVVPTHNRSRLLALTLRSILRQRAVNLEVVVVDDGSSDDTAAVVTSFGDGRVRMVRHNEPQGVSAARNRGIAEAAGDWVAFCDDDDLWAPDKLAKQLDIGTVTGRAWICSGHVDITSALKVVGGGPPPSSDEILRLLPYRNVVPGGGSGVIVRRDTLGQIGGFDSRLDNTADWELWLRLARQGPPGLVAEPLVAYRLHLGGASLREDGMLKEMAVIERTHGIQVSLAAFHRYQGWWSLRAGRRRRALTHFLCGLRRPDALYSAPQAVGDLIYLFSDSLVALASLGRRRARPWVGPGEITATWRQIAQEWLDQLLESDGLDRQIHHRIADVI